jgi:ADP-ribose pyrophosphatase YjhB (NUDIX family)
MTRVAVPIYAFVLVLVENKGRYLLIQEAKPDRGYPWFIPTGGVEPGESLVEAAKRETLEEAGLIVEPRHILRIDHVIPRGQGRQRPTPELWHFTIVAEVTGGTLKTIGDGHSRQAQWFRPEQMDSLNLRSPFVVELIAMHRRQAPSLPIEAYTSRVGHVY